MGDWEHRRRAEKTEREAKKKWEQHIREDERIRMQVREAPARAAAARVQDDSKKRADGAKALADRADYIDHFGKRNAALLTLSKWIGGSIVLAILANGAPASSTAMVVFAGSCIGIWRAISIALD